MNTAGSQRMTAQYMLKAWGIEGLDYSSGLSQAMREFADAHQQLVDSSLTTAEIQGLLSRVKKASAWFQARGCSTSGHLIPARLDISANDILADRDYTAAMYASPSQQAVNNQSPEVTL